MSEISNYDNEHLITLFNEACAHVKTIAASLSEEQLLQFYGFFKQAVEGPCSKSKPSWFQMTEKQKWQAWSSLSGMSKEEAMEKYINLLTALDNEWRNKCSEKSETTSWVHHSCLKSTDVEIEDSVKTMTDWIKEGNLSKVKSSSQNDWDVNKLDEEGLGLLHWAADRGTYEIVKYLVQDLGADINIKDIEGQTALHYAAFCGHEEVAQFLIQEGADINIKDKDGHTAYDIANNSKMKSILKGL